MSVMACKQCSQFPGEYGKEQVELENISRRRYPDKWGKLTDKDVNRLYNQNEVNMAIRTTARSDYKGTEICPYKYTGHGDSYFVSKDMYESLVAKCRCGRLRTEGHTIKCLQKVQSKYLNDGTDIDRETPQPPTTSSIASGDDVPSKRIHGKYDNVTAANDSLRCFNDNRRDSRSSRIPETSNGMIGWPNCRYTEWEQSTKYVSPIATMPGYKVSEHPYNVIFIG